MSDIVLILPYFGKLPNYFDFFIKSCENNKGKVDFLIFTDANFESRDNIKVVQIEWKEFCSLIQNKFDFEISLNYPYKLCDFKPTYGYVFQDYVKDYRWWGHCDCDLIWGDFNLLKPFINEKYDRIGIWGHLSIYRNEDKVNEYFKNLTSDKIPDYKKVYKSNLNYGFDEFSGMNILLKENNIPVCEERLFDDIIFYTKNFFSRRKILNFNPRHSTPMIFRYNQGTLIRYSYLNGKWIEDESLYIHLQKRNMEILTKDYESYWIVPNKFLPISSLTDKEMLNLSNNSLIDFRYYKMIWKSMLGKHFKRILRKWAK